MLFRKNFHKAIIIVKVIPSEECFQQHKLVVCNLKVKISPIKKRFFTSRIRTWKLKDPEIANQFCVESAWSLLKKSLLEAAVMKIIEFVSLAIIVQWYFIVQKLVTHKSNLTVLETYQM